MNTNISKEIADCLKKYLDGALDREKLKTELQALHSKMIEEKNKYAARKQSLCLYDTLGNYGDA